MRKIKPDSIIRVGDVVKMKPTTKFIKRVGYPLVWTDLIQEVEDDPVCRDIMLLIKGYKTDSRINKLMKFFSTKDRIPFDLIRFVAKQRVEQRNFGGSTRSIHYIDNEEHYGCWFGSVPDAISKNPMRVIGKRVVKTGVYDPGYASRSFFDEEEYEPPSLVDEKTHILIQLDGRDWSFGESVWVHVEDVEEKTIDSRIENGQK